MSEYSPDKFYTHATDQKGHSSQFRVAFPPNVASQIASLAASDKYPDYQTAQHVIRDAVFHRLQWLTENNVVDLSGMLSTWQVQIMIEKAAERRRLGQKILQDVNFLRLNARTAGDKLELKELIAAALTGDLPEEVRLELLRIGDYDI